MLTENKHFLKTIENDLPLVNKPFLSFAEDLGVSEDEILNLINTANKEGLIRRYGAVLGHRKAGFTFNLMVVFDVPDDKIDYVGKAFSEKYFVSHCYERHSCDQWPFNLYTMVHATSEEESLRFVDELKIAAEDYPFEILKSGKEYKKTSLKIL